MDHSKTVMTCCLAALMVCPAARSVRAANPFPLTYHSCQGEGCGCAKSPVVQADTVLYSEMSVSSKQMGILKKGQQARVVESNTIVEKAGRAKVTDVTTTQDIDLKVGDEIQLVLYKGEGNWLAWRNDKELELSESEDASLKIIERPKTETWFKLGSGTNEGYTQNFPFEGCLE